MQFFVLWVLFLAFTLSVGFIVTLLPPKVVIGLFPENRRPRLSRFALPVAAAGAMLVTYAAWRWVVVPPPPF